MSLAALSFDRRGFGRIAAGAGVAAVAGRGGVAAAAIPPGTVGNVVLVHGAYADGSCWADVIGRLLAAGVSVTAVQNPLTSLADDVAAARRVLDAQQRPTVLVAHSYGGSVISEVGDHPAVRSLVYLSARAPEAGENYPALSAKFPTPPANSGSVTRAGATQLTEQSFRNDFANGVDPVRAGILYAAQPPRAANLFDARTTRAAWRSRPNRYVVTTADRTTAPELQRFVAKRMNAQVIEIDSGHLSLITHPDVVTAFILDAVVRG